MFTSIRRLFNSFVQTVRKITRSSLEDLVLVAVVVVTAVIFKVFNL